MASSGLATLGCDGESAAPSKGKWLEECFADEECGSSGSCLCGRCTVACEDSCDDGPAGTECTRTSACGTIEAGVCVERCLRTADCAEGLVCKGGLCTASSDDDADAGAKDAEAFPGGHYPGNDGAWAHGRPMATTLALVKGCCSGAVPRARGVARASSRSPLATHTVGP